jgi:hypothetical protein
MWLVFFNEMYNPHNSWEKKRGEGARNGSFLVFERG